MGLADIFFPKRCVVCRQLGEYLCPDCFARLSFDVENICLVCNRHSLDGLTHPLCFGKYVIDGAFCAMVYKKGIKKLIYALKYQPFLYDLGDFLTDLFYEGLIQQEAYIAILNKYSPVFIPIPLSLRRFRKRGYNQAKILAQKLSKRQSLSITDCLERTKDTKPLFGLKREERKENMKGVFQIKKCQIEFTSAFLVDDLLTTGTTLLEAASVLKRNGFKRVWGVCLARDQ